MNILSANISVLNSICFTVMVLGSLGVYRAFKVSNNLLKLNVSWSYKITHEVHIQKQKEKKTAYIIPKEKSVLKVALPPHNKHVYTTR